MEDLTGLRSAINGFNRTDVKNLVEALCARYQRELQAAQEQMQTLQSESEELRSANTALVQRTYSLDSQLSQLKADYVQLQTVNSDLQAHIETLEQEASAAVKPAEPAEPAEPVAPAEAAPAEPAGNADAAPAGGIVFTNVTEQELTAYRRAEQAERCAILRAKRIEQHVSALCEAMRTRYQEAGEEINALTTDLSAGLSRLQETFTDVQVICNDAENAFEGLELPETAE